MQRNLISGALAYQQAQTADGPLRKQLDAFLATFREAHEAEAGMVTGQVEALQAAVDAQVERLEDKDRNIADSHFLLHASHYLGCGDGADTGHDSDISDFRLPKAAISF